MSAQVRTAWELTRRIAVRPYVKKAAAEAGGRVHAGSANNYPLTQALSPTCPETPWYIHLTDEHGLFWLLCFDFDGKQGGTSSPELVEAAQDQADALSSLLTSLAIAHVHCESSSSGGRHIWVALAQGAGVSLTSALATAAKANYRQLDQGMLSNRATGGARPPLSPHRNGSSSRVLAGDVAALTLRSTTIAQLQQLTEQLQAQRPAPLPDYAAAEHQAAFAGHRELSRWGQAQMAIAGGGPDPSATAFRCLLAAVNAGWSFGDALHAAKTAPGMEHFRTKNAGPDRRRRPRSNAQLHARLEAAWPKAQAIAALRRPLPPPRPQKDLSELEAIVTAAAAVTAAFRVSPGRWGKTLGRVSERSVLASLAYLTLQTGKSAVAAAARDLGPMAGIAASTAADALTRLQEAGFVDLVREHSGSNANEYRLSPHFSTASDTTRTQPPQHTRPPSELFTLRSVLVDELEQLLTDRRHDLFTYQGLGHYAGLVYAHIANGLPATVASISQLLGMSTRHTVVSLSLLRANRLIIRLKDGWTRAKRDLRARAARALGVAGVLELRQGRYQVDRQLWAWWQAEYAVMTGRPRDRPPRPHVTSRPLEFTAVALGERLWPRYPRDPDGLANHREARQYIEDGFLDPSSRWQLSYAA